MIKEVFATIGLFVVLACFLYLSLWQTAWMMEEQPCQEGPENTESFDDAPLGEIFTSYQCKGINFVENWSLPEA